MPKLVNRRLHLNGGATATIQTAEPDATPQDALLQPEAQSSRPLPWRRPVKAVQAPAAQETTVEDIVRKPVKAVQQSPAAQETTVEDIVRRPAKAAPAAQETTVEDIVRRPVGQQSPAAQETTVEDIVRKPVKAVQQPPAAQETTVEEAPAQASGDAPAQGSSRPMPWRRPSQASQQDAAVQDVPSQLRDLQNRAPMPWRRGGTAPSNRGDDGKLPPPLGGGSASSQAAQPDAATPQKPSWRHERQNSDVLETKQEVKPALLHTMEQLSALEATLNSIIEGVKIKATSVSFFCREYWGTSASMAQLSLDQIDWDEPLRRQVRRAAILESISLAVISQLSSGTMQDTAVGVRLKLRNLIFHVHFNCTVLLDLVRQRYKSESNESQNRLAYYDFDQLAHGGRYHQFGNGEHSGALRHHSELVLKQLPPLLGTSPGSSACNILSVVNDMLQGDSGFDVNDAMQVETVRSNMLERLCFEPLLDYPDMDGVCPVRDHFDRFGKDRFATDGTVVLHRILPPTFPDLETSPILPAPQKATGGRGGLYTYTLVLDLDETLIHSAEDEKSFAKRPGMDDFLQKMNSLGYELVIFTAATQDYADWVLNEADPNGLIKHRLYRQHALPWGSHYIKDLSRLGRDLSRTIILDDISSNFMLQPQNGVAITAWYENPRDRDLIDLVPFFEELIATRAKVPEYLQKHRHKMDKTFHNRSRSAIFSSDQVSADSCNSMMGGYQDGSNMVMNPVSSISSNGEMGNGSLPYMFVQQPQLFTCGGAGAPGVMQMMVPVQAFAVQNVQGHCQWVPQ